MNGHDDLDQVARTIIYDNRYMVYMSAVAELLTGADLERGIEIFSRVSISHGARPWTVEDVQPPAALRLYRAHVSEHWVLDPERRPDHRTRVRP